MKTLLATLMVSLTLPLLAAAQGYPPAATPPPATAGVVICNPCVPGLSGPAKAAAMSFAALAQALNPNAAVKLAVLQGNSTGTYPVPNITSGNVLIAGFALQDNLATAAFNYSLPWFLASSGVNPTAGWRTGAGVITDPASPNWTGFTIVWLYQ